MYAMFAALDAQYMAALSPERRAEVVRERKMARIRDKETNMKNRLERRRHAIWWKWTTRLTFFVLAMFGVPLFIWLVNLCWQLVLA